MLGNGPGQAEKLEFGLVWGVFKVVAAFRPQFGPVLALAVALVVAPVVELAVASVNDVSLREHSFSFLFREPRFLNLMSNERCRMVNTTIPNVSKGVSSLHLQSEPAGGLPKPIMN